MKPFVLASAVLLASLPAMAQATGDTAAAPTQAAASSTTPSAGDVLFEQPQLKNTTPGETLRYSYLRRSGISKGPYGPPLNDEIKLTIEQAKSADNRNVRVQMFSGGNRVPAGPFAEMASNPVLLLFLENHLKGVAGLLEANPRYIQLAIRKGLREKATVEPIRIDFKGRQVEGWRVTTKPFEGDPQTEKMRGFDTLTYTFVTSPEVPGQIVSIEAQAKKPDGGELLEEKLDYDQNAG